MRCFMVSRITTVTISVSIVTTKVAIISAWQLHSASENIVPTAVSFVLMVVFNETNIPVHRDCEN